MMRVAGCFLEYDNTFLILLRQGHKPDGNTWGLPSGKVEKGEQDIDAAIREVAEETGYKAAPDELEHLGDYDFTSSDGAPYVYATYRITLEHLHVVELEQDAHAAYDWITPEACYARPDLIKGFRELLQLTGYVSQAS